MPQPRRPPTRSVARRWIVAQREISEHIGGSPPAHVVLVYDPKADVIISAAVESTIDAAVAAAFVRIRKSAASGLATLACDPRVVKLAQLKSARFDPAPNVAAATHDELTATGALFEDFLATSTPAK